MSLTVSWRAGTGPKGGWGQSGPWTCDFSHCFPWAIVLDGGAGQRRWGVLSLTVQLGSRRERLFETAGVSGLCPEGAAPLPHSLGHSLKAELELALIALKWMVGTKIMESSWQCRSMQGEAQLFCHPSASCGPLSPLPPSPPPPVCPEVIGVPPPVTLRQQVWDCWGHPTPSP